ncbi:MAG: hypothetical protein RSA17_06395 [Ruthenibacterium sp.]
MINIFVDHFRGIVTVKKRSGCATAKTSDAQCSIEQPPAAGAAQHPAAYAGDNKGRACIDTAPQHALNF